MKNKIVILDALTLGDDVDLLSFKEFGELKIYQTTTYEETIKHIDDANIVITNKVVIDKSIIDKTDIDLICIAATGMNNIDLDYAKQKNIVVKNVKGYSTASVTQLTFSFALNFLQKLNYFDNYVKSKQWCDSPVFTNLSQVFSELDNKTWGIIGLGAIGENVAKIAKTFGCYVQYYSTSGMNKNTNYDMVSLETLLKTSDIISIHAPLNDTTNNLLNKTNLKYIKDGSIILNLGRGGIVNEADIANEVDKREIYFGTDVVSKEPIEKDNPLLKVVNKDRVLYTPHIGWASRESRIRLIEYIKENIKEFLL